MIGNEYNFETSDNFVDEYLLKVIAEALPSTGLSVSLLIEKNKLSSPNAWLITLDIVLPDNTSFYIVNNNESITFNSQVYTPFPFQIEPTKENVNGEIPTVTLRVSNVTRVLQPSLEANSGGVGASVLVRIINSAYLSENYSELEMNFTVIKTECDVNWVYFTLGAASPLVKRFPLYRYIASHCNWQFKSVECAYSGSDTYCDRTLDGPNGCRQKNNSRRFGGFPGMANASMVKVI